MNRYNIYVAWCIVTNLTQIINPYLDQYPRTLPQVSFQLIPLAKGNHYLDV